MGVHDDFNFEFYFNCCGLQLSVHFGVLKGNDHPYVFIIR